MTTPSPTDVICALKLCLFIERCEPSQRSVPVTCVSAVKLRDAIFYRYKRWYSPYEIEQVLDAHDDVEVYRRSTKGRKLDHPRYRMKELNDAYLKED